MKKTSLLLFWLFIIITGFSQIKVTGTLIDSVTHQPIQYSRISFGEQYNFGFLNTGNPLIYINFSVD